MFFIHHRRHHRLPSPPCHTSPRPHHPCSTANSYSRRRFLHRKLRCQRRMSGSHQFTVQSGHQRGASPRLCTRLVLIQSPLDHLADSVAGRRRVDRHGLAVTCVDLPGARGGFLAATSYLVTNEYTPVSVRSCALSVDGHSAAPTTYELTCAHTVENVLSSATCVVEHLHAATSETVTWQFILRHVCLGVANHVTSTCSQQGRQSLQRDATRECRGNSLLISREWDNRCNRPLKMVLLNFTSIRRPNSRHEGNVATDTISCLILCFLRYLTISLSQVTPSFWSLDFKVSWPSRGIFENRPNL